MPKSISSKKRGIGYFGASFYYEPEKKLLPTSIQPPANFTNDIMSSITPLLPFPLVGRLAKTCKWMNANITEAQVEQALERARPGFGKTELLTEPSRRVMLRVFNTEGNMLEVVQLHPNSRILVVKADGRIFIAAGPICPEGMMFTAFRKSEPPKMWFKFICIRRTENSSFTVNFITIDGINPYFAYEFMEFHEFVY